MSLFQADHGIICRRVHGESAEADMSSNSDKLPFIVQKIAMYAKRDMWNADESGLFLLQPSDWSRSASEVNGTNKDKSRLAFLASCKHNGSEKYPLMGTGYARRPRRFGKRSGQELGYHQNFNSKVWMDLILRDMNASICSLNRRTTDAIYYCWTIVRHMKVHMSVLCFVMSKFCISRQTLQVTFSQWMLE